MTEEQKLIVKEIKEACSNALKGFAYQSINDETLNHATKVLIDTIESFYASKKIAKFEVVCDRRNNFMETIDRGELHGRAVLAFNRTNVENERIVLDFVVYPAK